MNWNRARVWWRRHRRNVVLILVVLAASGILFYALRPTPPAGSVPATAKVIEIQDSSQMVGGLRLGFQVVTARIVSGPFRGETIIVRNQFVGNVLLDRPVAPGDRAFFMLDVQDGTIVRSKLVDYDRKIWHFILFALFGLALLLFAGYTGLRAFVSFVFTAVVVVRILLPGLLEGYDPLLMCTGLAAGIATVTLLLVGGVGIRALAAILGVTLGLTLTTILTLVTGQVLHIQGAASNFAVQLAFAGYSNLNLDRIFYGAVVLAASGALTDIGISVSASMEEVVRANPSLSVRRLIRSGLQVGRAALGTMITTLLLAYTGYSLFFVLLLRSKQTPLVRILTLNVISAEILRTLVGSTGMIMVVPVTAVVAGLFYHHQCAAASRRSENLTS
jgi:uncharacterized membrane protein